MRFSSDPTFVKRVLKASGRTPYLFMDANAIIRIAQEFVDVFSPERVFYAVKANPHADVVELLVQQGIGFEVSSTEELRQLLRLGIQGDRIISGNPVKTPEFIKMAVEHGVRYVAVDSFAEVDKISGFAPGAKVTVRVVVSNEGSEWPLTKKFGIPVADVLPLLTYALDRGLTPAGITFHVGSQCSRLATWVSAIDTAYEAWEGARGSGIEISVINLGGGFPIHYTQEVPERRALLESVLGYARSRFPNGTRFDVEPGRALVGEAGALVTSVIGKAHRDGKQWLYLDVGVFNGLMESIGGIRYPMVSMRNGPSIRYTIAGPSCDSVDVVAEEVELPSLEIGDRVIIYSAGAYTTAYASQFNGCPIPETVLG